MGEEYILPLNHEALLDNVDSTNKGKVNICKLMVTHIAGVTAELLHIERIASVPDATAKYRTALGEEMIARAGINPAFSSLVEIDLTELIVPGQLSGESWYRVMMACWTAINVYSSWSKHGQYLQEPNARQLVSKWFEATVHIFNEGQLCSGKLHMEVYQTYLGDDNTIPTSQPKALLFSRHLCPSPKMLVDLMVTDGNPAPLGLGYWASHDASPFGAFGIIDKSILLEMANSCDAASLLYYVQQFGKVGLAPEASHLYKRLKKVMSTDAYRFHDMNYGNNTLPMVFCHSLDFIAHMALVLHDDSALTHYTNPHSMRAQARKLAPAWTHAEPSTAAVGSKPASNGIAPGTPNIHPGIEGLAIVPPTPAPTPEPALAADAVKRPRDMDWPDTPRPIKSPYCRLNSGPVNKDLLLRLRLKVPGIAAALAANSSEGQSSNTAAASGLAGQVNCTCDEGDSPKYCPTSPEFVP